MTTKNTKIGVNKGDTEFRDELHAQSTIYIDNIIMHLEDLQRMCHGIAVESGWWDDIKTGGPLERNDGELICLMHSELSEALEGLRKNLRDDHLPDRLNAEVELADCIIRLLDFAEAKGYDIGGAVIAKLKYNTRREDHKPENRAKEGGKNF